MRCVDFHYYEAHGQNKLALTCEIPRGPLVREQWLWQPGCSDYIPLDGYQQPDDVTLQRHYNVGRMTADGRRAYSPKSDYVRDWIRITGKAPTRLDQISPRVFKNRLLFVRVRTVKVDWKRNPLPPAAHYSVIDAVLEVLD